MYQPFHMGISSVPSSLAALIRSNESYAGKVLLAMAHTVLATIM